MNTQNSTNYEGRLLLAEEMQAELEARHHTMNEQLRKLLIRLAIVEVSANEQGQDGRAVVEEALLAAMGQ